MAEWVKAAELQLELQRWLTSHYGSRWMRAWMKAESSSDPRKGDLYQALAQVEPYKLLTADAIWVAPEMCEVVEAASQHFQPEPLEREDFITPTGFLYLAKPLYMHDRNDKLVSVGALSWCPIQFRKDVTELPEGEPLLASAPGVAITGSDRATPREGEKWGMSIAMYSSSEAEHDDFSGHHKAARRNGEAGELIPLHFTVVEFGDLLDEGHLLDELGRYTGADEWWRLVQTTLRMMQQRVAAPIEERLPRASRRRMAAAEMSLSEVLVVRLRRPSAKHHEEESSTIEWTHRWIVDGHWRNQWYPSLNRHRQVWISPYVKGPEDKDLVIKKRYYKWDR